MKSRLKCVFAFKLQVLDLACTVTITLQSIILQRAFAHPYSNALAKLAQGVLLLTLMGSTCSEQPSVP
jgi:hypothetical protein